MAEFHLDSSRVMDRDSSVKWQRNGSVEVVDVELFRSWRTIGSCSVLCSGEALSCSCRLHSKDAIQTGPVLIPSAMCAIRFLWGQIATEGCSEPLG